MSSKRDRRAYYLANRERIKAAVAAYRIANPEKVKTARKESTRKRKERDPAAYRAYFREYHHKSGGRVKKRHYRNLPDPTRPESSVCECCGKPPGKRALSLDHDHATKTFRGWLCAACNLGIGKLGDSLIGVRAAVAYLERTR